MNAFNVAPTRRPLTLSVHPFEVTIVEDSIASTGIRLITFHLCYWRPIHSEVMTHRKFSRNARSSRAVPNRVLLREHIFEPLVWGANNPGMQSHSELTGWRKWLARTTWRTLARITRVGVRIMNFAGLHKQWSNRPLEWFGFIDVLITSTDWANWFALRDHAAAQPEIRHLAQQMKRAMDVSNPTLLKSGEWHLPYVTPRERAEMALEDQIKLSVARCARISYTPFDGEGNLIAELRRYRRLIVDSPVHASPAEHQATPDERLRFEGEHMWAHPSEHGNLTGWRQYRKLLPNEWVSG